MNKVGILNPGEMGISVAASAINSGCEVYWAPEGRSKQTRERAEHHGLLEVSSLSDLCRVSKIIVSVCPPHAAQDVAQSVIDADFKGLYLDANAIAPKRSIIIGQQLESAGIRFVDGSIIGGPAWKPKKTWLYLSGYSANEIASCFSKGPLETKTIGTEIGKASALKMCYAAYSKGTTAMLAAILAASESLGVHEHLYEQWDMDTPGYSDQVKERVERVSAKAWRFEGEMKEIAATFQDTGLPGKFHEAAAEVYHRITEQVNRVPGSTLHEIVAAIPRK